MKSRWENKEPRPDRQWLVFTLPVKATDVVVKIDKRLPWNIVKIWAVHFSVFVPSPPAFPGGGDGYVGSISLGFNEGASRLIYHGVYNRVTHSLRKINDIIVRERVHPNSLMQGFYLNQLPIGPLGPIDYKLKIYLDCDHE